MGVDDADFQRALGPLLELVSGSSTVTRDDLLARLAQVVDAAVVVLRVGGVGVILLDEDDEPRVAAATDEAASALETAQAAHGEGPGIDAMRRATSVAVADLRAAGYPRLRAALDDSVMRAVLSSPIRVGDSVVGNFNAFLPEPHEWTAAQIRANGAYADVIGLALRIFAQAAVAGATVDRLQGQFDLLGRPAEMGGDR
jgi:hypothetical protein